MHKLFCWGCKSRDVDIDCRLLYGNFTIENNTLQYKYLNEEHGNTPNKIAVLGFDKVFVDIILKYFDIHYIKIDEYEFYYIRPAFYIEDIDNNFVNMPISRTVTAYRDTTEFFFPYIKIYIYIINKSSVQFVPGKAGFVESSFKINLQKSHIDFDKYILLGDKITTQLPISYLLSIKNVTDPNVIITGKAEYIVLKDEFDQFNMFKLRVGDIYSADEYRELSYRKSMGITVNTVYLQNASSMELLTRLLTRIFMHLPLVATAETSLWQSIRDIVSDKGTLEDIYKLLYHAYPHETTGPQTKRIKIDFN